MEPLSSSAERTFHPFPKLPVELRLAIWRECLPHRVAELDTPSYQEVFSVENYKEPAPCVLWYTSCRNSHQPLIALVCRESRAVVLETGYWPGLQDDFPPEYEWASGNMLDEWFDPTRDLPHVNYVPGYEAHFGHDRSPLLDLAWQAARARRGGSLRLDFLRYCYEEDLEVIERLPSWVVVMRIFVIHASRRFAAATGLFGLLGDARVQIVNVSEQAKVDAFFDLAKGCEHKGKATVRQNFQRVSAESLRQELKDVVIEQFGSLQRAPEMHPAIMFRLCTEMCNHSELAEDWFRPPVREARE